MVLGVTTHHSKKRAKRKETHLFIGSKGRTDRRELIFLVPWKLIQSSFVVFPTMVNDSVSVTFTLSMLNVSLIIASVLYLFCFVLAKRKLSSLRKCDTQCNTQYSNITFLLLCYHVILSSIFKIIDLKFHFHLTFSLLHLRTRVDRMHPDLSLKKLLLLSVLIVSFMRVMTFLGVTMMDIANVRAHYIPNPAHYHRHYHNDNNNGYEKIAHNQSFYDSSMMVLFDLPNAIVVSTVSEFPCVLSSHLCMIQSQY